jgi:hypothetical protein
MRALTLTAAALCLALAPPARAEQFRYRFRPGQVIQNRASVAGASLMGPPAGPMMKVQFRASLRQTQRVRSVNGGVVTLDITDLPTSGSVTSMGRTEPYDRSPSRSVVRLSERGRFISRKSTDAGEASMLAGGMDGADALYGLNFPARDLKPGDTWEDTLALGEPAAAVKVRMVGKYVGRETFRGRSCARFVVTITSPASPDGDESAGQGKLSGTVTTYFDPAAGVEVYSSGSLVMVNRSDLGSVTAEGGELVMATKINVVQSLVTGRRR